MSAPKRPIRTRKASSETVPESAEAVRDARDRSEEVLSSPPGRAGADSEGLTTEPTTPTDAETIRRVGERATGDDIEQTERFGADRPDRTARPLIGEDGDSDLPVQARRDRRWTDQPVVTLASGAVMPRLGLGTWQLSPADAELAVRAGLDVGFRHIDTAQMYGNEAAVGAALDTSDVERDDVFITTKVANDRHAPGALVAGVHDSLDALGTDHVDLLLVHWPVDFDQAAATADVMAQVQASGLAAHIGLSNFTVDQLSVVAGFAPFEVLQAERHPFFPQPELVAWCRTHGWAFTAYSPLAQGRVFDDETIAAIAADHGVTPAAVAIAWQLRDDGVAVIPRSSVADHLRDNWTAQTLELTDRDLGALATVRTDERLVDPDFAPW
ncbi:MAG: aldo/keto reductase [Acidimicrobiales bacterium]